MMTIGSVCSGIGGLERGLELTGSMKTVWQIEVDSFCRRVLAKHWPEAIRYDDLRSVEVARLGRVDVVCGGLPCQPVSVAGKRLAQKDARWLWPDFARIVAGVAPSWVVVENVLGLRTAGLRDVLVDLADLGFDAEWTCLSAADVGAPHLRKRLFIVASHPDRVVVREQPGWLVRSLERQRAPITGEALAVLLGADADGEQPGWREVRDGQPDVPGSAAASAESSPSNADCLRRLESARRFSELRGWPSYGGGDFGPAARMDDGLSGGLDLGARRKALGNAVVVPCATAVGRAILQTMEAACSS